MMNQAQSRRLRMRCLLLLAPLLVAGRPSPLPLARGVVLTAAPSRLVFLPLPEEIAKGQCVPVTVEARDGSGTPSSPGNPLTLRLGSSLLGGVFFGSSTCQSIISSVVLPGNAERVQVWFKATALGLVTLTASDGLLGLSDALSLPIFVVLNPTARIVFVRPPSSATAGQPVDFTLEARDALGFVAAGYSGTIEFTSTDPRAVRPPRYTFNPSTDRGRKTFQVTFQSGGTWELVAQDVANPNFRASAPGIRVQAAAAVRLEIEGLAPSTSPGRPLTFRVIGVDRDGNPGRVDGLLNFEPSDPEAVIPDSGRPLQPSYTVTFYSPGEQTLSVWVPGSDPLLSFTARTVVDDIEPREVELSASVPRVPTCDTVELTMEVDSPGVPVAVTLCRPDGRSATIVRTANIDDLVTTEQCITGSVGRVERTATVEWRNEVGEDVEFKLYGTQTARTEMVSWVPEPKPENTSFLFLGTTESIPKLAVSTGERTLQLNMSDTCPKPLVLPPDRQPVFLATPPLAITPIPYNPDTPGEWQVSVRLPECPADPTQPLAIWPTINGRELLKPGGGRIEQLVQPRCATAVELSLDDPDNGGKVEPGEVVELEAELANNGRQPILNGVLMVSTEGLTVLEVLLDGEPLTARDGGFVIPELLPDKKLKVKVKAQATTNLEQVMNATVWYADEDGEELTPHQAVELTLTGPGVNVGCGCHAASLPSQLWPWLALLLAASRPWDRSRRVRRGERIDR